MKHHWSSTGGQSHLSGYECGIFPQLRVCRGEGREREWGFTNHGNKDCRLQGYPTEWPLNRPQQQSGGGLGREKKDWKGREDRAREVSGTMCVHTSFWPPVLHCQRAVIHRGWICGEGLYVEGKKNWDERFSICLAWLQQKRNVYGGSEGIINMIHHLSCSLRRIKIHLCPDPVQTLFFGTQTIHIF